MKWTRRWCFGAVAAGAMASCGGPGGTPSTPATPSATVAPAPASRAASPVSADAGAALPAAEATVPCAKPIASGSVKGSAVRVCLRQDAEGDPPFVWTRVEDASGKLLAPEGTVMAFRPTGGATAQVTFRDVTGDGIEDVLVQAPGDGAEQHPTCRYVIDGSKLGAGDDSELLLAQGHSLAAAVSTEADPWSGVVRFNAPISAKEACGLLRGARTVAGFAKNATADAEVVDFREPTAPYCLSRVTHKGVTRARLNDIYRDPCSELECSKTSSLCVSGPRDPDRQFYLFLKGADGRFKIRAITLYRGS